MKTKTWKEVGIDIPKHSHDQFKMLCPRCSHTRKKNPDELCLSVNTKLNGGSWNCQHCGWQGRLDPNTYDKTEHFNWHKSNFTKPKYEPDEHELVPEVIKFFKDRGISRETLDANLIGYSKITYDNKKTYQVSASFPFIKNGEIVNVQHRSIKAKNFRLVPQAEKPFYGFQHIVDDGVLQTDKVIIVEGMMDKLALYEAGSRYVLSVPNGSPFEEEGEKPRTPNLEFLNDPDFIKVMENVKDFTLAMDNDYQGIRLRDSIAERIGFEKCKTVKYPEGSKDMNDVLMQHGAAEVLRVLEDAVNYPIKGLVEVNEIEDELISYYHTGLGTGLTCGINDLDEIFTLANPAVITVTGVPESLKSVLMDNLMVRYAEEHGLKAAYFSPESRPEKFHIGRLASIRSGYNFGSSGDKDRMPFEVWQENYKWANDHFVFLNPPNNKLTEIMALAKAAIVQKGIKILVIDPFSKISFEGENMHNSIRDMFIMLNNFAVENNITIFLVAHPKKLEFKPLRKGEREPEIRDYRIATPYDIAESSHFYNGSDYIMSLWRTRLEGDDAPLHIYIQKSKLHNIAKSGERVILDYDITNWRIGEGQ